MTRPHGFQWGEQGSVLQAFDDVVVLGGLALLAVAVDQARRWRARRTG
ncbi:MAG: hypothetical protein ABI776_00535 [Nocardioidaceae bacterium]